jgi:hypothetical protein
MLGNLVMLALICGAYYYYNYVLEDKPKRLRHKRPPPPRRQKYPTEPSLPRQRLLEEEDEEDGEGEWIPEEEFQKAAPLEALQNVEKQLKMIGRGISKLNPEDPRFQAHCDLVIHLLENHQVWTSRMYSPLVGGRWNTWK